MFNKSMAERRAENLKHALENAVERVRKFQEELAKQGATPAEINSAMKVLDSAVQEAQAQLDALKLSGGLQ